SGLARGIDAAAHTGALAGGTAAVMAGGVDVVYPPENAELYASIVAEGVVLSEQPVGTQPTARHFPIRNRLVSGLALGTVVVDAAPRSGSLITARLALEQGREVFAVPGSPLDTRTRGTNDLIRNGATLVETARDVVEALRGISARPLAEPGQGRFKAPAPAIDDQALVVARKAIHKLLSPTPVTVDELIRQCQMSAPIVATVLLELELAGRLERRAGGWVALAP
ncbi:MAG: DNA-processing protein DprA, partial [Alphaproteobacteria bacterium]|nr:DNA-processing protein DprA [Alphaproteobacteria bacterium]